MAAAQTFDGLVVQTLNMLAAYLWDKASRKNIDVVLLL